MIHRTRPVARSAAAVAAALAILSACGSSAPAGGQSPTPTDAVQSPPTTTTATPAATPAGPPGGPVPAGFAPLSVTFVSLQDGFVLGTAPCSGGSSGSCVVVLRTADAGHSWASIPAPSTSPTTRGSYGGHGVSGIRFADPQDGWVFGPELWATHDGGGTWVRVTLPGASSSAAVADLAASAGRVQAAVFDHQVEIESSPTDHDAWSRSPVTIGFGAGPVPQARLVLHGSAGWLIEVDRTVMGGARLSSGQWSRWTPPCSNSGGDAMVDASSDSDLVAVCNEGVWFGGPPVTHAYLSTDGGASFSRAPGTVPIGNADQVASSSPQVAVVAGHTNGGGINELLRTADGGASWTEVFHTAGTAIAVDLGFTSPTQGVIVEVDQNASSLQMTFDAGQHWSAVVFH